MSNLDEFFSRYGSPAKEANERVDIYHTRADCIDNMRRITAEDRRAVREIAEMQKYIEVLKAYRKTLYERAQALCTAAYHLQLKGNYAASGYCVYPEYEFDLTKFE